MAEKPIIFNGEMVRAILEGRKTQTRRVMKKQPRMGKRGLWLCGESLWLKGVTPKLPLIGVPSPYGYAGDELWVRETFGFDPDVDAQMKDDGETPGSLDLDSVMHIEYRATMQDGLVKRWRPSIHMPRYASRIQLRVTGVRVERLQDISCDDIRAEGVVAGMQANHEQWPVKNIKDDCYQLHQDFVWLWDKINGKPRKNGVDISWSANPWVWVVEFEKVN